MGGGGALPGVAAHWTTVPNALDKKPWTKNRGLLKLNWFVSVIFVGMFINGYDGSATSNLLAMPQWNEALGEPSATRVGLMNSLEHIGGFLICPLAGYVLDRWGRKPVLQWYAFTMVIGSVLGCVAGTSSGTHAYALFCVSRLVTGFGMTPGLMVVLIIIHEIAHPRHRAFCAGAVNAWWTLGATVVSLISFGSSYIPSNWSWRLPYLLQIPLALYLAISVLFMPESPRWLAANGREEEALDFFARYHGDGDRDDPLVQLEMAECVAAIQAEKNAKAQKWSTIARSPVERKRMGLASLFTFAYSMCGQWLISIYYSVVLEIAGITGTGQTIGLGTGMNMFGFLTQIVGSWCMTRIGRRTQMCSAWTLQILFMIAICVSSKVFVDSNDTNLGAGYATVPFVWLYFATVNWASPVAFAYPTEILSFSTRAKGMTLWSALYQAWGIYAVFVDSIGLDQGGPMYYILYILLQAIQLVLFAIFMVETQGMTLEEIDIAFNGSKSAVAKVDQQLEDHADLGAHIVQTDSESDDKKGATLA